MPSEKSLRTRLKFATRGIATGLRDRFTFESAGPDLDVPSLDDVIDRVQAAARSSQADDARKDVDRALDKLRGQLGSAIAALRKNPNAELTPGQELALETVVKVDGTRPSTLLRDGRLSDDDAQLGEWRAELAPFAAAIRQFAGATGRIEPNDGSASNFFGTGFLVGADGIVLTNWHVLEAMLRRSSTLAEEIDGTFRIHDGVRIDFAGETQSLARRRYKVVSATPSGIDGNSFARLDIAVLRIEPLPESPPLPAAIPLIADLNAAQGATAPVCVIGFPGRPEQISGTTDGIDWTWVTSQLITGGYGLKRFAPGEITPIVGAIDGDTRPWVMGHDATTLGGSSGSPLLLLHADAPATAGAHTPGHAFGIHFAGSSGTAQRVNYAHALTDDARDRLVALQVAVGKP